MAPSNESGVFGVPERESSTKDSPSGYGYTELDMPRLKAKALVTLSMMVMVGWYIFRLIKSSILASKRKAKLADGYASGQDVPAELRAKAPVAVGVWSIGFMALIGLGYIGIVTMMP
jgi:hypothetical protein